MTPLTRQKIFQVTLRTPFTRMPATKLSNERLLTNFPHRSSLLVPQRVHSPRFPLYDRNPALSIGCTWRTSQRLLSKW